MSKLDLFPETVAITGTSPTVGGRLLFAGKPIRAVGIARAGDSVASEPMALAPVWPAGILPDALEAYATAQARSIGVPLEIVTVPLSVFAGGTNGNMVRMQLMPTWNVFPTLWGGGINDPAAKKSPASQAAHWPVNKAQYALVEQSQAERAAYDAEHADKKKPSTSPPALEHVFTTDATMEALVRILVGSRGVSIVMEELSGLIGGMDKYRSGKGDDR